MLQSHYQLATYILGFYKNSQQFNSKYFFLFDPKTIESVIFDYVGSTHNHPLYHINDNINTYVGKIWHYLNEQQFIIRYLNGLIGTESLFTKDQSPLFKSHIINSIMTIATLEHLSKPLYKDILDTSTISHYMRAKYKRSSDLANCTTLTEDKMQL